MGCLERFEKQCQEWFMTAREEVWAYQEATAGLLWHWGFSTRERFFAPCSCLLLPLSPPDDTKSAILLVLSTLEYRR